MAEQIEVEVQADSGEYLLVVVGKKPGEPRFVMREGSLTSCTHDTRVIRSSSKSANSIIRSHNLQDKYVAKMTE